jgi:arylformamidase
MHVKFNPAIQPITRRSLLGAAAVAAATPAVGQTTPVVCPIGPPPHDEGPLVWMDMDQIELDAAYDQSFYAPLRAQISRRRASDSELARARLGAPRREAYGPTEPEKLDIHRTTRPNAPMFVFIHGGAWLSGEAKNYTYAAEMFVNAGAHFIALDFVAIGPAGGGLGLQERREFWRR